MVDKDIRKEEFDVNKREMRGGLERGGTWSRELSELQSEGEDTEGTA